MQEHNSIAPTASPIVAVVVPCYKVRAHILDVLHRIGPGCDRIYVVDDKCPEGSGHLVERDASDPRITVLYHEENQGVGGAMITGYRRAMADGATVVVKIDGDGQMDPALLHLFVAPILAGDADYTKGNRFDDLASIESMPRIRAIGNAGLSFFAKLSSGYWQLFDPNNGYTAIHTAVLQSLPLGKISKRYFFESDMLFRLGTRRAVVRDIPMKAVYNDEQSNLLITRVTGEFLRKHMRNFVKRIFYTYFLRDFNIASIELLMAVPFLLCGVTFGGIAWYQSNRLDQPASSGTVMLAALPIIIGIQLLLSFLNYDLQNVPQVPIHKRLYHPPVGTR